MQDDHMEREAAQRQEQHALLSMYTIGMNRFLIENDIPMIKPPKLNRANGRMLQIKGPFSPLQIEVFGLTKNTSNKIKIHQHSVNHILLENEPNDM